MRTWRTWVHNGVKREDTWTSHRVGTLRILQRLCDWLSAPEGEVRQVHGHTLKVMKGEQWEGTRRMRRGRVRVLYDWRRTADGEAVLWVHDIFVKTKKEDYDTGLTRCIDWHRLERDGQVGRVEGSENSSLPYWPTIVSRTEEDVAAPDRIEAWELNDDQESALRQIFPLHDPGRPENPWVRLVEGPPGSGKTVVAQNAVAAAVDARSDCDVLVIVPTVRLKQQYRDHVLMWGMDLVEAGLLHVNDGVFADRASSPIAKGEPTHVWIETVDEAFRGSAQPDVARLRSWWRGVVAQPILRQHLQQQDCELMSSPRFARLLDGVLFDGIEEAASEKDALAAQDRRLLELIGKLERTTGLRRLIEKSRDEQGVAFRWQRAAAFEAVLERAHPDRQLLVLVDEVQDLVPAEWQALLRASLRRRATAETGIALLGDENQRITPTCFSWDGVRKFVKTLNPKREVLSVLAMKGSFRTPRTVGRMAVPLVLDPRFRLEGEKPRNAPTADPEKLEPGGQVYLFQCTEAQTPIQAVEGAVREVAAIDRRGQIVVLADHVEELRAHHRDLPLDFLDIVEAKGSEWESVVLLGIYPAGRGDYDERCRAYTRMTRTKSHLLIVAASDGRDGHAFSLLKEVAKAYPSEAVDVLPSGNLGALRDVLALGFRQVQTVEQLVERLHQVLAEAQADGEEFPEQGLELLVRVAQAGGEVAIPSLLDDYLQERPDWAEQLQGVAGEASPAARRIVVHLALGDIFEAERIAAATHAALAGTLRHAVQEAGTLTRAIYRLRASAPSVPLTALLGVELAGRVHQTIANGTPGSAPSWVEEAPTWPLTPGRWRKQVDSGLDHWRLRCTEPFERELGAAQQQAEVLVRSIIQRWPGESHAARMDEVERRLRQAARDMAGEA